MLTDERRLLLRLTVKREYYLKPIAGAPWETKQEQERNIWQDDLKELFRVLLNCLCVCIHVHWCTSVCLCVRAQ